MILPLFLSVCAVVATGAPLPSAWVGSESEEIGSFDGDDSTVFDNFNDLKDSLDGVGFDFSDESDELVVPIAPTESSSPSPDDEFSGDVSGNSFDDLSSFLDSYYADMELDEEFEELYSSYNSYYGSISTTYVEYMRGYLSKLAPKEHYVASRVGQYDYIFASGVDLQYDSYFHGACTVVHFNTYNNGNFYVDYDSNFSLYPGSNLVYTDLTYIYPSLATSSDVTLRQVLFLITIASLVVTMINMYNVRKIRRVATRKNS